MGLFAVLILGLAFGSVLAGLRAWQVAEARRNGRQESFFPPLVPNQPPPRRMPMPPQEPAHARPQTVHDVQTVVVRRPMPTVLPAPAPVVSVPVPEQPAPSDDAVVVMGKSDPAGRVLPATPPPFPLAVQSVDIRHIPLLKDTAGRTRTFSFLSSQHMIVCGLSGSGKGNLVQLLAWLAAASGPDVAHVWILDPKGGLDYAPFRNYVHTRLYAQNCNQADGNLSTGFARAKSEMDRRSKLMFGKARNLHEYNALPGVEKLPVLVLVCDEVSELKDRASDRERLNTLARMGRALGIVLISIVQYPTAEVLSSQVQANSAVRVVFRLASKRYTPVALGIPLGEEPVYEPADITEPGVAVLKIDGDTRFGRAPEMTPEVIQSIEATMMPWLRETAQPALPDPMEDVPDIPEPAEPLMPVAASVPFIEEAMLRRVMQGLLAELIVTTPSALKESPPSETLAPPEGKAERPAPPLRKVNLSDLHVRAALHMQAQPDMTASRLAALLHPGTGARYRKEVQAIMDEVRPYLKEL